MRNCITYALALRRRLKRRDPYLYLSWRVSRVSRRVPHCQVVTGNRRHWIGLAPTFEHFETTRALAWWNPRKWFRMLHFRGRVRWGDPPATVIGTFHEGIRPMWGGSRGAGRQAPDARPREGEPTDDPRTIYDNPPG